MNIFYWILIPIILISLWNIFRPIFVELRKKDPTNIIIKKPVAYFLVASIVSVIFFPYMLYLIYFGNCSSFQEKILEECTKLDHSVK